MTPHTGITPTLTSTGDALGLTEATVRLGTGEQQVTALDRVALTVDRASCSP